MNPTNLLMASNLLLDIMAKGQALTLAMQRAHSEGRDLTDAELLKFVSDDDAARARLQAAIDARKAFLVGQPQLIV